MAEVRPDGGDLLMARRSLAAPPLGVECLEDRRVLSLGGLLTGLLQPLAPVTAPVAPVAPMAASTTAPSTSSTTPTAPSGTGLGLNLGLGSLLDVNLSIGGGSLLQVGLSVGGTSPSNSLLGASLAIGSNTGSGSLLQANVDVGGSATSAPLLGVSIGGGGTSGGGGLLGVSLSTGTGGGSGLSLNVGGVTGQQPSGSVLGVPTSPGGGVSLPLIVGGNTGTSTPATLLPLLGGPAGTGGVAGSTGLSPQAAGPGGMFLAAGGGQGGATSSEPAAAADSSAPEAAFTGMEPNSFFLTALDFELPASLLTDLSAEPTDDGTTVTALLPLAGKPANSGAGAGVNSTSAVTGLTGASAETAAAPAGVDNTGALEDEGEDEVILDAQGAGLLDRLRAGTTAALDQALRALLDEIDQLGAGLGAALARQPLTAWVTGFLAAAIVCEVMHRRRQRAGVDAVPPDADGLTLLVDPGRLADV